MAAVDAAICFFIPYYAIRANGQRTGNDVFSVGKTVFTALLGTVTLEVCSQRTHYLASIVKSPTHWAMQSIRSQIKSRVNGRGCLLLQHSARCSAHTI